MNKISWRKKKSDKIELYISSKLTANMSSDSNASCPFYSILKNSNYHFTPFYKIQIMEVLDFPFSETKNIHCPFKKKLSFV